MEQVCRAPPLGGITTNPGGVYPDHQQGWWLSQVAVIRILEPIKEMLKTENTQAFLDVLDIDEMPTNSDVVLVLNQYMNAMKIFYEKYYTYNSKDGHKWRIQS